MLTSLDSYPVSNGEPVNCFRQRNFWIIFELQKKMTLTGCKRLIIWSKDLESKSSMQDLVKA